MHIDEFRLKYEPVFVDLVEQKPKENASKVKLVLYYLSSYFFKFSKKDIQNKYNHRSFWWNEKDELIFMSDFLSNRDFVDNIDKTEYFETFFRDYYTGLKLEFPDRIISKDLEEVGQKSLYEDWLKIISGKKVTINYAKSKYKEI